ncbi:hypothetical protein [Cryobacterium sp.]|uniref:hypothetical protein n=1 Tax=Cryobacterium sp. TaxID=1926290 RepID=UPI002637E94F|nr:hypothetical protein [Cryobacterium sp.]MCU1446273.1 hypothetical protein [Cryobacterium sp.]
MSNDHPELSGYEPHDSARPLRGRRMVLLMRLVVLLGLVALIVPGILTSLSIASATAVRACTQAVARYYPLSEGLDARFELTGAGGFGWQCYAIDQNERQTFVTPLGIIPGPFRPPATGVS